jgi:hypothetical protein
VFSVARYNGQAGDLVPDRDVTLVRAADGDFYPLTYQNARADRCSADLGSDGGVRANRVQHVDFAGLHRRVDEEYQVSEPRGLATSTSAIALLRRLACGHEDG